MYATKGIPLNITVNTLPNCRHCSRVKKYLDDHDITYRTVNLMDDDTARDRVKAAGFKQAPIIEADGFAPHSGFNAALLDQIIAADHKS